MYNVYVYKCVCDRSFWRILEYVLYMCHTSCTKLHACPLLQGARVTLISSYTDKSGLFTSDPEHDGEAPDTNEPHTGQQKATARSEAEEEDELLYGDIDALIGKEKLVWFHLL